MANKRKYPPVQLNETHYDWTILEIRPGDKHGRRLLCRCVCGREKIVREGNLVRGGSKRCRNCSRRIAKTKHGDSMGDCRLYEIWKSMKSRCGPTCDEKMKKWYFDKGIRVCDEWQNYEPFRDWAMSHGYADNLSIDRIKGELGYSPDNCRWSTQKSQCRNKSNNMILTAFGETKTAVEWSEDPRCAISRAALCIRIHRGFGHEYAITTPRMKPFQLTAEAPIGMGPS